MVKRALTLLTSILIALPLLMPFNIFADESVNTAPFLGVNVQFTEVETDYTSMTMPILNFGYAGTPNTTGSVTGKLACSALSAGECKTWSLQNSNGNSVAGLSFTMNLANLKLTENGVWQFNKAYNYIVDYEFVLDGDYKGYVVLNDETTIYVNGRSFHHSVKQSGISELTFTITNYELNKVVNPIYWNIHNESINIVSETLLHDIEIYAFQDIYYLNYPLFKVKINDVIFNKSLNNDKWTYIFYLSNYIRDGSQFLSHFQLTDVNVNKFEILNYRLSFPDNQIGFLYRVDFTTLYNGNKRYVFKPNYNEYYIPIYFNLSSVNKYVSTEFALQYGLSNRMLDDINLIANGTVQSNSASQSSNSANSQLQTESNTLFQQENGFKSDMQSAMQNINNTFRLQDMGTKFVSSAQWVRTQYEQLTNNTPFASLITFSLITGLALILLGKVYR